MHDRELMANRKDPVVARPVKTTADTVTEDDFVKYFITKNKPVTFLTRTICNGYKFLRRFFLRF